MDCPHCRWSCCLRSRGSMDAPYSCSTQVNTNTLIDAMAWLGQEQAHVMAVLDGRFLSESSRTLSARNAEQLPHGVWADFPSRLSYVGWNRPFVIKLDC